MVENIASGYSDFWLRRFHGMEWAGGMEWLAASQVVLSQFTWEETRNLVGATRIFLKKKGVRELGRVTKKLPSHRAQGAFSLKKTKEIRGSARRTFSLENTPGPAGLQRMISKTNLLLSPSPAFHVQNLRSHFLNMQHAVTLSTRQTSAKLTGKPAFYDIIMIYGFQINRRFIRISRGKNNGLFDKSTWIMVDLDPRRFWIFFIQIHSRRI